MAPMSFSIIGEIVSEKPDGNKKKIETTQILVIKVNKQTNKDTDILNAKYHEYTIFH